MAKYIDEKVRSSLRQSSTGSVAPDRDRQLKLLVPNSTAGMIIGTGGCFVRQIKEKTGASVQISSKSKEVSANYEWISQR
jgi:transcription antitermination factor NusA-like protein